MDAYIIIKRIKELTIECSNCFTFILMVKLHKIRTVSSLKGMTSLPLSSWLETEIPEEKHHVHKPIIHPKQLESKQLIHHIYNNYIITKKHPKIMKIYNLSRKKQNCSKDLPLASDQWIFFLIHLLKLWVRCRMAVSFHHNKSHRWQEKNCWKQNWAVSFHHNKFHRWQEKTVGNKTGKFHNFVLQKVCEGKRKWKTKNTTKWTRFINVGQYW